ncbi:MAG: putative Zn-dependent peptidase [Chlamydiales bacterium]|jgi:predicted Zn-dependent peptidase
MDAAWPAGQAAPYNPSTMSPLILSLALAGLQATPAVETSGERALDPIEQSVVDFTLGNGWRFLLVPRPGPPIVAIETVIDIGSVDEQEGKRGLANLFAHLTLQGSERLGSTNWSSERVALSTVEESFLSWRQAREQDPDESAAPRAAFVDARDRAREFVSAEGFRRFLEDAGGAPSIQVESAPDWTRYAVSLPSNQLETWCWLEAERFTRPCLRGFFSERDRWLETRHRELEAAPWTILLEQLRLAVFTTHPYRYPASGSIDDLSNFSRADAENFFREHYGARRFVTTIVGGMEPVRVRALIERYFTAAPAGVQADAPAVPDRPEPQPTLERRIAISFDAPALMAIGWSVPEHAHVDTPAVELTARILGPHPGSRLHRRLVRQDAMAADLTLQTGWPGDLSASLVLVKLAPLAGVEPLAIERAVTEELHDLRENGPSDQSLAMARRSLIAERQRALNDPVQLARLLNRQLLLTGDWRSAFDHDERWQGVTAQSVQAVVDVYFTDVRRAIAGLQPKQHAAPPAPEAATDESAGVQTEEPR